MPFFALAAAAFALSGCGGNAEIVRFPVYRPQVSVGSPAFDFTLPDTEGHSLSLVSFQGKKLVLLAFDRGVSDEGCRRRLRALAGACSDLQASSVQILAITADPPAEAKTFFEKAGLPYPLLTDPDVHVIRLFGVAHEGGRNGYDAGRPALFLLDREGVVRFADVPSDDAGRALPAGLLDKARELAR